MKYKASDVIGKLASSPLFKDSTNASDYDPNDTASICIDKETGFVLKFSGTKKGVGAGRCSSPRRSATRPTATSRRRSRPETLPSIPNVSIPNVSIPERE